MSIRLGKHGLPFINLWWVLPITFLSWISTCIWEISFQRESNPSAILFSPVLLRLFATVKLHDTLNQIPNAVSIGPFWQSVLKEILTSTHAFSFVLFPASFVYGCILLCLFYWCILAEGFTFQQRCFSHHSTTILLLLFSMNNCVQMQGVPWFR